MTTSTCACSTRSSRRRCDAFEPELVLVSAGFDAHEDDPLARDAASPRTVSASSRARSAALAPRVAAVLEGGYNLETLPASSRPRSRASEDADEHRSRASASATSISRSPTSIAPSTSTAASSASSSAQRYGDPGRVRLRRRLSPSHRPEHLGERGRLAAASGHDRPLPPRHPLSRPARRSPTPCGGSSTPASRSTAPPTTASARRSTCATRTATASSSTGTARRTNGPATPDGGLAMYTRRLDLQDLLDEAENYVPV